MVSDTKVIKSIISNIDEIMSYLMEMSSLLDNVEGFLSSNDYLLLTDSEKNRLVMFVESRSKLLEKILN